MYGNDPKLIPRSTYRKNVGEGIRTITCGAHTSLVASERAGKFVTNVTTAVGHEVCLMKCHKLATLMPEKFPYLCITVVHSTTGEALLPHWWGLLILWRQRRESTLNSTTRKVGVSKLASGDLFLALFCITSFRDSDFGTYLLM